MKDDLNYTGDRQQKQISDQERQRILSVMNKMLEMGIGAVYGQEEEGLPDAVVDCRRRIQECMAACCTLTFALTRDEIQKGYIRHNLKKPFFISRSADGYCTHLDRDTMECMVWNDRPLRCRRYDCTESRKDP
jgi:hypothetical protein